MRAPRKSAAYRLVELVWSYAQTTAWQGHRGDGINQVMRQAVTLAIRAHMDFAIDDCARFSGAFRAGYWLDVERWYSEAVDVGSDAACRAFEAHFRRAPYRDETGGRIAVGARQRWRGEWVKVTRLERERLILCSHREDGYKVLHRYAVSREEWRAEMKRRKDARKEAKTKPTEASDA